MNDLGILKLSRYTSLPLSSLSSMYFTAFLVRFMAFEKLEKLEKKFTKTPSMMIMQGVLID